ncbi:MAG: TlpA disulfide reductase family protein [Gilvibacter sp.]
MKHYIGLALMLLIFGCKDTPKDNDTAPLSEVVTKTTSIGATQAAQSEVPIYAFADFEHLLHKDDGKTYVVNFWATWCKPCIKEMPYFEELAANYKDKNVEVLFVSLDFPRLLEKQVIPFIKENNIQSKVVLLDDTGANEWIPKVDEFWSGAIPATLVYRGNYRKFYEKSFDYAQLEAVVKDVMKL